MEKFTQERREEIVRRYFALLGSDSAVSIRTYAAMVGVKYYTFRDWYRDYKASSALGARKCDDFHGKRKAGWLEAVGSTRGDDSGMPFVAISCGGNHVL